MRLFLGVDLPPQIKTHIADFLRPLQDTPKGWENPHDYHQTLLFIGEASTEDAEFIKERLKNFSFHPFKLRTGEFQFFNRRIMYLGLNESSELQELKKLVDEAFPEWVRPEEKPFVPHITVKRWQRYEYAHLKRGLEERKFKPEYFEVMGLSLFKSEKDSLNRKYHVITTKYF